MQVLLLKSDQLELARKGVKRATIRRGEIDVKPGCLSLYSCDDAGSEPVKVTATEVVETQLKYVSDADAAGWGLTSVAHIRELQTGWHPDFTDEDIITVVKFAGPSPA